MVPLALLRLNWTWVQLNHYKFDELEKLGVFKRLEEINVAVEYLHLSFLVKKGKGGYRLVTAFVDVGRYSKPQQASCPTLIPPFAKSLSGGISLLLISQVPFINPSGTTLGNFCFKSGQLCSGPCEAWVLIKTNSRWRREARRITADYNGIEEAWKHQELRFQTNNWNEDKLNCSLSNISAQ